MWAFWIYAKIMGTLTANGRGKGVGEATWEPPLSLSMVCRRAGDGAGEGQHRPRVLFGWKNPGWPGNHALFLMIPHHQRKIFQCHFSLSVPSSLKEGWLSPSHAGRLCERDARCSTNRPFSPRNRRRFDKRGAASASSRGLSGHRVLAAWEQPCSSRQNRVALQ